MRLSWQAPQLYRGRSVSIRREAVKGASLLTLGRAINSPAGGDAPRFNVSGCYPLAGRPPDAGLPSRSGYPAGLRTINVEQSDQCDSDDQ